MYVNGMVIVGGVLFDCLGYFILLMIVCDIDEDVCLVCEE